MPSLLAATMATEQGHAPASAYTGPPADHADLHAQSTGAHRPFEDDAQPSTFTNNNNNDNQLNHQGAPTGYANADQITTTDGQRKRRISKKTQQRLYWCVANVSIQFL